MVDIWDFVRSIVTFKAMHFIGQMSPKLREDNDGSTLLMWAADGDSFDMVHFLVKLRAAENTSDDDESTLFMWSAKNN